MTTMPMPQESPIEQRLATLEQQFAELRTQVLGVKPRAKNWQRTAGTFPRDEMTLEAERLGREWRSRPTGQ